ncbi:MAG: CDP-alcohol phosphatidyltransferase family protein [Chlamydiia bacterium]|nr:CDP-alcohol phosphatidyltransferase family protein [Chlamydiia bacterium]
MLNFSNVLSLSRAALALVFLKENIILRLLAILIAMSTDVLDGFIARRSGTTSQFGAILDPLMDKFFVFFVGGVLYLEGGLTGFELGAMLSRDISLCFFGIYLVATRGWKEYECGSILWGKVTTCTQFIVLIGVTLHVVFPTYIFLLFILMAIFAFIELIVGNQRKREGD